MDEHLDQASRPARRGASGPRGRVQDMQMNDVRCIGVLGGVALSLVCSLVPEAQEAFATNRAFVAFSRCVVPLQWTSDLSRFYHPELRQAAPAEECLQRVRTLSASPRLLARVDLAMGDIAARGRRLEDALNRYRSAQARLANAEPGIALDVVKLLMTGKDYQRALDAALEALTALPGDHDLRVTAGILYLFYVPPYGRYAEAIAVMRPDLGFSHPYYYNIAAGSYLGLGEFVKGVSLAAEAVRRGRELRDPSLPTSLYLLGVLQRCSGAPRAGEASLREAIALAPAHAEARAALGDDTPSVCGSSRP